MWLILIDHSGSMGGEFRASADKATFRDRRTQQRVKLDAAVESVLIELRRLAASALTATQVSLFGFTSSVEFLHEGEARDLEGFAAALRRLVPENGTDIAAALDGARMHVAGVSADTTFHRFLLVTDGLSDLTEARRAARDCAQAHITVDVVVIDPIDEARDLAAAVAGETTGRWEPVFGPEDLDRAAADARSGLETQTQRLQEAASEIAAFAAALRVETAKRERVLFTAAYPGLLMPGVWHPLYVHVLQDSLRDQLETRLAELSARLGPQPQRTEALANSMIPPGTVLEIQPVFSAVRCRPRRRTITWNEALAEVAFQVQAVAPAGVDEICRGNVLVSAHGLLIAQIPVSFSVAAGHDAGMPGLRTSSAQMISQVFGSYAHSDADVVTRFRAAYRALGIHLFIDTLDINGGEPWRRFLEEQIERSDLFQLFWSAAAAASKAVEDEWQHALGVAANGPVGARFIRPVYWTKPLPGPPEPLAGIQFWYFDLRNFKGRTTRQWQRWRDWVKPRWWRIPRPMRNRGPRAQL